MRNLMTVGAILVASTISLAAEAKRMTVKVIDVQNSESEYSGTIPGRVNTYVGTSTINTTVTPAQEVGYSVKGATLQLLLPDGRTAVVNCVSEYAPRGDYVNRRSCRVPDQNVITVEFKGKDAKLLGNKLQGSMSGSRVGDVYHHRGPTSTAVSMWTAQSWRVTVPGANITPVRVSFAHPALENIAEHRRFFHGRVRARPGSGSQPEHRRYRVLSTVFRTCGVSPIVPAVDRSDATSVQREG